MPSLYSSSGPDRYTKLQPASIQQATPGRKSDLLALSEPPGHQCQRCCFSKADRETNFDFIVWQATPGNHFWFFLISQPHQDTAFSLFHSPSHAETPMLSLSSFSWPHRQTDLSLFHSASQTGTPILAFPPSARGHRSFLCFTWQARLGHRF